MNKKIVISATILIGLIIAYWLISPLFINKEISEPLTDIAPTEEAQIISQGKFIGLDFHNAEGTVKLLQIDKKIYIRFEDDFKVTNGPDLFVHFGKNGDYSPHANLGELKGNIGAQNYEVPENINIEDFDEIWVWCRAFSVPFGKAELQK
ncbi:MAG: DM13 domain-containing protein [bacterium]|nr:DM13 domain-containing protein [bacterium]